MSHAKLPNLRHIRLALAILEGGSLRQAARRMNMTEPAASLALAALEEFYGVAFFERSRRGLVATDYGAVLQRRAVRCMFLVSRAVLDLVPGTPDSNMTVRAIGGLTAGQLEAIAGMQQSTTFRTAAEITGLQPTVIQRRLDALERTLGQSLTHRSKAGVYLNAQGRGFSIFAGRAVSELRAIGSELAELEGGMSGSVSLGVVRVTASEILPEAILQLTKIAPRGRIVLMHDNYETMLEALRGGRLDYICSTIRPNLPADVEGDILGSARLRVFCSPHHPLAKREYVSIEELALCRWIGPPRMTGAAGAFRRMFERGGLEPPGFVIETAWSEATRRLVLAGDFLAVTSTILNDRDSALNGLHMLETADLDLVRPIWLLHRKGWGPTRLQRVFGDVLRQAYDHYAREAGL